MDELYCEYCNRSATFVVFLEQQHYGTSIINGMPSTDDRTLIGSPEHVGDDCYYCDDHVPDIVCNSVDNGFDYKIQTYVSILVILENTADENNALFRHRLLSAFQTYYSAYGQCVVESSDYKATEFDPETGCLGFVVTGRLSR